MCFPLFGNKPKNANFSSILQQNLTETLKNAKKQILTSAASKMLVKIYNKGDKEVSKRVCRGCVTAVAVERKKPDHAIETDPYLK